MMTAILKKFELKKEEKKKKQTNWIRDFRDQCSKMKNHSITRKNLPYGGTISRAEPAECWHCHQITRPYVGIGIDCEELYFTAIAKCCLEPRCRKVMTQEMHYDLYSENPKSFLKVLKTKLQDQTLLTNVEEAGVCPDCKGKCYSFSKESENGEDLDSWKVCINPRCECSGEYKKEILHSKKRFGSRISI